MEIIPLTNLTSEELEKLFVLNNLAFPKSVWPKKNFEDYFTQDEFFPLGFVLKIDAEISSFVFGKITPSRKFFNIDSLWISEKQRGKSFGKTLVEKLLKEIKKIESVETVGLRFREANRLEKFYQQLGFSQPKIIGQYKNGENKIGMKLKIK